MLRGVADAFKTRHHGVKVRDDALAAAVQAFRALHSGAAIAGQGDQPDRHCRCRRFALGRQTVPEALKALRNEIELLEKEADWLSKEPETPENIERSRKIEAEKERFASEIETLQAKFDEEIRLVREADRLERIFLKDEDDW
jgi:type VI secretion system protein VasG